MSLTGKNRSKVLLNNLPKATVTQCTDYGLKPSSPALELTLLFTLLDNFSKAKKPDLKELN